MEKILTLEEVAALLKVSERTVVDWVTKGDIPGGKIGTTWRFQEHEIQAWLNSKLSPRINKVKQTYNSLTTIPFKENIILSNAKSKSELLNLLIDKLSTSAGVVNRAELANAIFSREEIMSTGIGLGIGVPHCRLNNVKDIHVAVAINKSGLNDYESLDGTQVQIVIMILAGRNQHTEYIKILSLFSSHLKLDSVRQSLLKAGSTEEIYSILTTGELL